MIDIRTFFRKNRRLVSGLGMILAVLLIFWSVSSPAIVGVSASQRSLPVYSVERGDKCVSLSFDAAWGNEDTQTLIDILSAHGVNATFFVVGDWAEKYPESVKALAEAGNEVMNHSSDHAHFSSLSTEQILSDLSACNEKVAALTGVAPSLFRCPYGEYDDHVIQAVESLGMTAVQWGSPTGCCRTSAPAASSSSTTLPSTPRRPCPASSKRFSRRATPSCPSLSFCCRAIPIRTTPEGSGPGDGKSPPEARPQEG